MENMKLRDDSDNNAPPNLEKERLLSIIEYAQQAARMRQNPAATIGQHQNFALHEHQAQGLPGVRFSSGSPDDDDELWIAVERLRESKPPEESNRWLSPWLNLSGNPSEEPSLRASVAGQALIDAGTHQSSKSSLFSKRDDA